MTLVVAFAPGVTLAVPAPVKPPVKPRFVSAAPAVCRVNQCSKACARPERCADHGCTACRSWRANVGVVVCRTAAVGGSMRATSAVSSTWGVGSNWANMAAQIPCHALAAGVSGSSSSISSKSSNRGSCAGARARNTRTRCASENCCVSLCSTLSELRTVRSRVMTAGASSCSA